MSRFLVAIGDTEGVPFRTSRRTELWNLFLEVVGVVEKKADGLKVVDEDIFHIIHMVKNKQDEHKETRTIMLTHNHAIDYLYERYEIDGGMFVLCWNAPHDEKVINYYMDKNGKPVCDKPQLHFVDVLKWARKEIKPKQSMKLSTVVHALGLGEGIGGKTHTALTDTLYVKQIINKIGSVEEVLNKCHKESKESSRISKRSKEIQSKESTLESPMKETSVSGTSTSYLEKPMNIIQDLFSTLRLNSQ